MHKTRNHKVFKACNSRLWCKVDEKDRFKLVLHHSIPKPTSLVNTLYFDPFIPNFPFSAILDISWEE